MITAVLSPTGIAPEVWLRRIADTNERRCGDQWCDRSVRHEQKAALDTEAYYTPNMVTLSTHSPASNRISNHRSALWCLGERRRADAIALPKLYRSRLLCRRARPEALLHAPSVQAPLLIVGPAPIATSVEFDPGKHGGAQHIPTEGQRRGQSVGKRWAGQGRA